MDKNLYKNGIKFKCQGSSNCCISRGNHGFVFLSNKDLNRLSKHFNLSKNEFIEKYCESTDNYIHLKEISKIGECIFLINKKCSVYKSRPTQCRTWPFWPENMKSKTWNKDVLNFCPGIGKGKLFNKEKIEKIIEEDKKNANEIHIIKKLISS